ncbi:MAG: cation transporter [Phaeodactylibacter sp.]|nr:cation transporter [Phaeodactylibacter sp.]
MSAGKTIRFAQSLALVVGLVLMGLKFVAWWETNSNAILTDALESIINVAAASFGLYSIWLSALPKDGNHPYGHGKIEFISAGFEGALILLAGLSIMVKSGYNFFFPQPIAQLDLGLIITAITGVVNYGLGAYLVNLGRKQHTLILKASGAHLKSDAYSSLGLMVGLVLVMVTGLPLLDNIIAVFFGGFIIYTGFNLVRTSIAGIMDEADDQLLHEIVQMLQEKRRDQWIDIHNFRVIKYGGTLHIDCHMTLPWYYNTQQNFKEIEAFEKLMTDHSERSLELFVHIDPCDPPENCALCALASCPHRKAPHKKQIEWTLENIKENQKHRF